MEQFKSGINLHGIDKLIIDIYDYSDKISKTLDQISIVVSNTSSYYVSTQANRYRTKFNNFSANFKVVRNNIITYADDLKKVKFKYNMIDQDVSSKVKIETTKIDN